MVSKKELVKWRRPTIEKVQSEVKTELDKAIVDGSTSDRLNLALQRIGELEENNSPDGLLRRYVFIVSALLHHSRSGGLTNTQIKNLEDMAYTILKIQGIDPTESRLSFLYNDVNLAMSQIYRKDGRIFLSTWEHQLASHLSNRGALTEDGFQSLGMAIRATRLGLGNMALEFYRRAETEGLSPQELNRARLGRIRLLRLRGELEKAAELATQAQKDLDLSDDEKKELYWEELCRDIQTTQDLDLLVKNVQKDADHYSRTYVLEACLWVRAVSSENWLSSISTLQTLTKNLKVHKAGFAHKCVQEIQRCYDYDYSFMDRLRRLGHLLSQLNNLVSIDHELLMWAAAARWLARSRSHNLASVALNEYRYLCERLSGGTKQDCLGIVSDLFQKEWFVGGETNGKNS